MNNNSESQRDLVFAADLGGTHLRTAVVDRDGQINHRQKEQTPQSDQPETILRTIIERFRKCELLTSEGDKSIRALTVGVPGTVDIAEGKVLTVPNLKSLEGYFLGAELTRELGRPATLENDANAAAVGEWWHGAARGYQTVICVTLGTGVGGGLILDGKLWRGADGSAGEVGHIAVDPFSSEPCGCGSAGCLEVFASATALVRMTRELKPRYPGSALNNDDELTAEKIFAAAARKDELALRVFNRMATHLGIGLASIINLFNPEMIVIAGGVANAWEVFEADLQRQISKRAFPIPVQRVKVVKGECGDDAGLLGAAWLAFESCG